MKRCFRRALPHIILWGSLAVILIVGVLGSLFLPGGVLKPQTCQIDTVVEIHPGDTMASVAYAHGVTVEQVRMVNAKDPGDLQPGSYVNLPMCRE